MVKTKEHSNDLRSRVIEKYEEGLGYDKISSSLLLPKSTVRAIIKKFQKTGSVSNNGNRGRKPLILQRRKGNIISDVAKVFRMNGKKKTILVRTEDEVPKEVAFMIAASANEAIKASGRFTIGVSGGSMAKFVCSAATSMKTQWSKWLIFFCDERLVPTTDPDSTYGLYKAGLIGKTPLTEENFVYVNTGLDVSEAAKQYERHLREIFGDVSFPTFDLLLLGMGPDGHTASLFPNHSLLKERNLWIAPISDSPKPPPCRVTMTFPVINSAKCCLFAATGAGKADMVKRVLADEEDLPTTHVSPQHLVWILDEGASSKLPPELLQ